MFTNILNFIKKLAKIFLNTKELIGGYFAFKEEVIDLNPIQSTRILHFFYWRIL